MSSRTREGETKDRDIRAGSSWDILE